ncbi:MAG: deoxyhypusine synthase family protein [Congregibacter sp.]
MITSQRPQQPHSIAAFLEENFKHFNARETLHAAKGFHRFVEQENGCMVLSIAGAMSTAELGKTLAPLIRAGFVHAISATGANIEEDLFNLVGNSRYKQQPNWRYLTMADDARTLDEGYNRVTDTCIPEDVMLEIHAALRCLWQAAEHEGRRYFHWEYFYQLIDSGFFDDKHEVPLQDSWLIAAFERGIPVYTPGAEDSTIGNMFCADVIQGHLASHTILKSGTEQFEHLTHWYMEHERQHPIGFFQIGGGIAGDFAMCVVPAIIQDHQTACRHWRYFCHIGDAVTSFGGYSGCPPNEKVTWHKLDPDSENYTINSDASLIAPLIFQYVLEKSASKQARCSVCDHIAEPRHA